MGSHKKHLPCFPLRSGLGLDALYFVLVRLGQLVEDKSIGKLLGDIDFKYFFILWCLFLWLKNFILKIVFVSNVFEKFFLLNNAVVLQQLTSKGFICFS